MKETFGTRLQNLRLSAGLTVRELGRMSGVDYSQISRYEKGSARPRPAGMIKLAVALNTTLEYLREGETEDESVSRLEHAIGPLPNIEEVEFTAEEYTKLLEATNSTGLSMPEMIKLSVLIGLLHHVQESPLPVEALTGKTHQEMVRSLRKSIAAIQASIVKPKPTKPKPRPKSAKPKSSK